MKGLFEKGELPRQTASATPSGKGNLKQLGKIGIGLILGLYAIIGVACVSDYGISWDEPYQYHYGQVVLDFIQGKNTNLLTDSERHYGPVVPTLMTAVEKLTSPQTSQDIYHQRHLINFLIHLCGALAFVWLLHQRFRSYTVSIAGLLMFILSPRFFAEAFYNSKDLPFMDMFIITCSLGFALINSAFSWAWLVPTACAAALLTDMRILGILSVPLLLGGCFFKASFKEFCIKAAVFLGIYGSVVVLCWPTLWSNPLAQFWEAFQRMSHYPWEGTVLYLGEFIKSTDLPWHYPFVWIAITTPPLYLIAAGFGLGVMIYKTLTRKNNPQNRVFDGIVTLWLCLPLGLVLGLNSVLYDGWRHLYFIYPCILYFGCMGIDTLHSYISQKYEVFKPYWLRFFNASILIVVPYCLWITFVMIDLHPFQNVYFNLFAGERSTIHTQFEMDYWGQSYKAGLNYIAAAHSQPVNIFPALFPGLANGLILSEDEKSRVRLVENPQQAQYFVTNFRWHPDEYPLPEVYNVTVDGMKILGVYRVNYPVGSAATPSEKGN
jgi:hypothetical protein